MGDRNDQRAGASRATIIRDRTVRQLRWRLRYFGPAVRRPLASWRHAALESQDGILASYPRSGSRWLEQMLGELLLGREIDFQTKPYPILYISWIRDHPDALRSLANGGRVIKTHYRYRGEYRRAIYLVRHPGDVAISYYHYTSRWTLPGIGFERWFEAWLRGQIDAFGNWQDNVESWLDAPVPVELIRYEDLKRRPVSALQSALGVLGVERDPDEVRRVVQNNSLETMTAKLERDYRHRPMVDLPQPREATEAVRGGSGVWRESLTTQQVELLKRRAGRAMKKCGYGFGEVGDREVGTTAGSGATGSRG